VILRPGRSAGVLMGLAAVVTFGAAAPLAKRLLENASPQLLAGLLYLGAFLALLAVLPSRRRRAREARLQRNDLPRLTALVICGGILAPLMLLVGLERLSGTAGSLMLNLEGPFTLIIGVTLFREHVGRRAAFGGVVVFGGAALLSLGGPAGSVDATGASCIAVACLLWGIDNNLTQSLTLRDPFSIVGVKTGAAATVNVTLAVALGAAIPSTAIIVAALGLGAVSYGVSIVLDAYALRALGAAREAVIFATAPFIGAVLALPVLSEALTPTDVAAGCFMAAGLGLMLSERHDHWHVHEPIVHEHAHVHDQHHRHDHEDALVTEPHSHVHRHGDLAHAHSHVSDIHHRHRHERRSLAQGSK
jgi:drug/metabolite transporter (DMT)-like permease